jgi:hypothetical protein
LKLGVLECEKKCESSAFELRGVAGIDPGELTDEQECDGACSDGLLGTGGPKPKSGGGYSVVEDEDGTENSSKDPMLTVSKTGGPACGSRR